MKFQRFKKFIEAVEPTKRAWMVHLEKIKPLDFIKLIKSFEKDFAGVIPKEKVSIQEKIDGNNFKIGIDEKGEFFAESSYAGPFFKVGQFKLHGMARYKDEEHPIVNIYSSFDDAFQAFKKLPIAAHLKTKFPEGVKIHGELLINANAQIVGKKGLKFVGIEYDKTKLGSDYTFAIFQVTDTQGLDLPNTQAIIKELVKFSTPSIKITDTDVESSDIDLRFEISGFNKMLKKFTNVEAIILSRKKVDKEAKTLLKNFILQYQEKMAEKMISVINSGRFSLNKDDFEGVVIRLIDTGQIIKVTSPKQKSIMAAKKSAKK